MIDPLNSLANTFGIDGVTGNNIQEIVIPPEKEQVVSKDYSEEDYLTVRKNLKDLLKKTESAVDGILEVAQASDSARAYEVAATLIKTNMEINEKLFDINKKKNESVIKNDNREINHTNNNLFVGNSNDLLDLIKKQIGNNNGK